MAKRKEDSTTTLLGVMIKSKTLRRVLWSGDIDACWRRMLLGFAPSRSYFHTIWQRAPYGLPWQTCQSEDIMLMLGSCWC